MIIILDQGATERRTLTLDGTEDLSGASARLAATSANGLKVLDLDLPLVAAARMLEIVVPASVSSAWDLKAWGSRQLVQGQEGDRTATGYRADFQIEVLLSSGDTRRVHLGDEAFFVVTPELVK